MLRASAIGSTLVLWSLLFSACGRAAPPAAGKPTTVTDRTPGDAPGGRSTELTDQEVADGWIALFDGQTLFGWTHPKPADWRVENGAIVVSRGDPGLLLTTAEFSNYVLKLDFRADAATNSGVFLQTPLEPTSPARDCYELNIAPPENPFPTGSLVQRARVDSAGPSTNWRTFEVTVDGDHILVRLDDRLLLDHREPRPLARGHIGLQLNQGAVAFRHIKLKPLGLEPLFNGRDLSGWQPGAQGAARFSVTPEGDLSVTGGSDQLESERRFGDFVLQAEFRTLARNINSGIFFRCIPGSAMDGYESQIHEAFRGGDRAQPVDGGTGAIFRRQNARRVMGDDLTWVRMTICAQGHHMGVWVNGYQVTDWNDDRPADPNPRKGSRVEPGTIMLQAHDATTQLLFRNLRAAELPARPAAP